MEHEQAGCDVESEEWPEFAEVMNFECHVHRLAIARRSKAADETVRMSMARASAAKLTIDDLKIRSHLIGLCNLSDDYSYAVASILGDLQGLYAPTVMVLGSDLALSKNADVRGAALDSMADFAIANPEQAVDLTAISGLLGVLRDTLHRQ